MKTKWIIVVLGLMTITAFSQELPLLKIAENRDYIVTQDNKPFLWMGCTAWELIHRLNKDEIDLYLTDRANKGFTVVQTVILAELDGLNAPNAYGDKPLIGNNPEKINDKYFEVVDYVVKRASELGIYVGLLPSWGDKWNIKWGIGPEIFTPQNAEKYGEILAKRYISKNNIIWILGGDRAPETENHFAVVRAMAKGIRKVDNRHLITYHPVGGKKASDFFPEDSWLDLDMFQSGHSRVVKEYDFVTGSKTAAIKRPVINGEARYENIPDRFWEDKYYGWLDDADVRVSAYWSMMAGCAGYTYGCNDIWQMYETGKEPVINARTGWKAALHLPGSSQMKYLKELFGVLPWQEIKLNQSPVLNENKQDESYLIAATSPKNDLALVYTPTGKPVKFDLLKLNAGKVKAFWFNPRSGRITNIGEFDTKGPHEFIPWANGWGSDFVLIIADSGSGYNFENFNK